MKQEDCIMANRQPSPQSATRSSQRESDADRADSPQDQDGTWSAVESGGEDGIDQNGSRKRKRTRPMSVSCELCKQRKVKCGASYTDWPSRYPAEFDSQIEDNQVVDGARGIDMYVNIRSEESQVSRTATCFPC